nr:hypothetical protein [Acinetobacter lwoffii]
MILIIAVLAILLLIACVGWWNCYRSKQLVEAVSEFNRNAVNDLQIWLYEEKQTVEALKAELSERPLPEANKESEPDEVGTFVKTRMSRPATPETYRNVFDLDVNGQRILAHLAHMYTTKSTYVRGGHDAERESCFRAGQADVIGFIYKQINRANDPNYKQEDEVND